MTYHYECGCIDGCQYDDEEEHECSICDYGVLIDDE